MECIECSGVKAELISLGKTDEALGRRADIIDAKVEGHTKLIIGTLASALIAAGSSIIGLVITAGKLA